LSLAANRVLHRTSVVQILEHRHPRMHSSDVAQAFPYSAEQARPIVLGILGCGQLNLEHATQTALQNPPPGTMATATFSSVSPAVERTASPSKGWRTRFR
jgi:hypothetical protein